MPVSVHLVSEPDHDAANAECLLLRAKIGKVVALRDGDGGQAVEGFESDYSDAAAGAHLIQEGRDTLT